MNNIDASAIVREGIDRLVLEQQKDGSFLHFSSKDANNFGNSKIYHSIFPTVLILSALADIPPLTSLQKIKQKAANFLLSQKNTDWSFNYWAKNSEESKYMFYPNDLDDTFSALSALFMYNPRLITGTAWAKIVKILTYTEEKEGGPYRTWIVPKNTDHKWLDIDLAVNCNIAYFLYLHDINLPGLTSFIENRINQNQIFSAYYPTEYPIIYFLSRLFRKSSQSVKIFKKSISEKLQERLFFKRENDGSWEENPLFTALTVTSLLNFGVPTKKLSQSFMYLLSLKESERQNSYPLYMDPQINGKKCYAGSSSLTNVFCLEAIARYLEKEKSIQTSKAKASNHLNSTEQTLLYNNIIKKIKDRFQFFDYDLRNKIFLLLDESLHRDRYIALMPYLFKTALGKYGATITDDTVIQLGAANVLGWVAYTIYDDFLDEEGDPASLPLANIALRELTSIFDTVLPKTKAFKRVFHDIMDRLDAQNYWEVTNCRVRVNEGALDLTHLSLPSLGNYQMLARKSLGHALSSIAILFLLEYKGKSQELKSTISFFSHYLIARQLNDDAHDWEKDLKMGHLNSAGIRLLASYQKRYGKQSVLTPAKHTQILKKLFWEEVIIEICNSMIKHVKLADKALSDNPLIEEPDSLKQLLISIEESANYTLNEQKEMANFIGEY